MTDLNSIKNQISELPPGHSKEISRERRDLEAQQAGLEQRLRECTESPCWEQTIPCTLACTEGYYCLPTQPHGHMYRHFPCPRHTTSPKNSFDVTKCEVGDTSLIT